jgi:hypothetical protein
MLFGFTPPGSDPIGAVFLTVTTTLFFLKYAVGQNGWSVDLNYGPADPGTIVDLGGRGYRANVWKRPPPDAVPCNQFTYDFMISQGMVGMGYPYWTTAVGPGVVGFMPQVGRLISTVQNPGY